MVDPIDPSGIRPLKPLRPVKPGDRPVGRRRRRRDDATDESGSRDRKGQDQRTGRHIDEHC